MLSKADRRRIAVNLWTARIIPFVLAGAVGYATYVLVAVLCVQYLLVDHEAKRAAIAILVTYFILLFLMTICFLRLLHVTIFSPPYLPLGATASRVGGGSKKRRKSSSSNNGIARGAYDGGSSSQDTEKSQGLKNDPDSPGLELFYTKDLFICEADGRPKWCSECENWKRDRTHHCSSSRRCILKMDHFCPWVGGPIGENNFKFFLQFTGWAATYCTHVLIVMAYFIHKQVTSETESLDPQFGAVLGLAAFFGLFTVGMTGTSIDLVLCNLTQVEKLGLQTRVHIFAVYKPNSNRPVQSKDEDESSGLPAPYSEIIYPLNADQNLRPRPNIHSEKAQDPRPRDDLSITVGAFPEPEKLNQSHTAAEALVGPDTADIKISTADPSRKRADSRSGMVGGWPNKISPRDMRAIRKFAILRMPEPGINPWNLGSPFLNWQTVMGTSFIDWVLPMKRSPCCNHDDSRSQYALGPAVDNLCASHGLKARKRSGSGRHGSTLRRGQLPR